MVKLINRLLKPVYAKFLKGNIQYPIPRRKQPYCCTILLSFAYCLDKQFDLFLFRRKVGPFSAQKICLATEMFIPLVWESYREMIRHSTQQPCHTFDLYFVGDIDCYMTRHHRLLVYGTVGCKCPYWQVDSRQADGHTRRCYERMFLLRPL